MEELIPGNLRMLGLQHLLFIKGDQSKLLKNFTKQMGLGGWGV